MHFVFVFCSDVFSKRGSMIVNNTNYGGININNNNNANNLYSGGSSSSSNSCNNASSVGSTDLLHNSTHTLTSTCSPSTCTTPSSVYVIEEHCDENYIATEVQPKAEDISLLISSLFSLYPHHGNSDGASACNRFRT